MIWFRGKRSGILKISESNISSRQETSLVKDKKKLLQTLSYYLFVYSYRSTSSIYVYMSKEIRVFQSFR